MKHTQLQIIDNADKEKIKKESWSDGRSLAAFPHPARILALGKPGRGKTNALKLAFLEHQKPSVSKKKSNPFLNMFVIAPNGGNEWADCEPDAVYDDIPDNFAKILNPDEKSILILDDFELMKLNIKQIRKLASLFRFVSSHLNCSVYMSYQSFFDAPSICRKCANVFFIWDSTSKQEMNTINNRLGLDKGVLSYCFKEYATGDFDFIVVDCTIGSPSKLRLNMKHPIDYNDVLTGIKKDRVLELREIRRAVKEAEIESSE